MKPRLTQIIYQQVIFEINEIDLKIKKNKDYTEHLDELIIIMIKPEILNKEISFNQFFNLSYHCLWEILIECEYREEYEICGIINKIINNEEVLYKEWIQTLPSDQQIEANEEFEIIKKQILIKRENDNKR